MWWKVYLIAILIPVVTMTDLDPQDKEQTGVFLHRKDNSPRYDREEGVIALKKPQHPARGTSVQVPDETSIEYDFEWVVKVPSSGINLGHEEVKTEDGLTRGSYFTLLPDGRKQTVNYHVRRESGYVADVSYEGKATYPVQLVLAARVQPLPPPLPVRVSSVSHKEGVILSERPQSHIPMQTKSRTRITPSPLVKIYNQGPWDKQGSSIKGSASKPLVSYPKSSNSLLHPYPLSLLHQILFDN